MVNEGLEHALEVAAVDDQQPVEALGTDGADETLRDRVRFGACGGVLMISMPSLAKMARTRV